MCFCRVPRQIQLPTTGRFGLVVRGFEPLLFAAGKWGTPPFHYQSTTLHFTTDKWKDQLGTRSLRNGTLFEPQNPAGRRGWLSDRPGGDSLRLPRRRELVEFVAAWVWRSKIGPPKWSPGEWKQGRPLAGCWSNFDPQVLPVGQPCISHSVRM